MIVREPVSGYTLLDTKRAPTIHIQPSVAAFAERFEQMSDGLLRGLDWTNICAAGGIILGSLLCVHGVEGVAKPAEWVNSDIDLYVYGLSPIQSNEKIRHIFDVYKRNLPEGAPALIVRNSKTVTFFSKFPLRRIQIVLKLVHSPKEVLLNFDLDVCSLCWDGSELWLLPRACRALESEFSLRSEAEVLLTRGPTAGYNVFTMNLIHGHYLGERRATQEAR